MSNAEETACHMALRILEEQHGVVDAFACLGSSSWVTIKNVAFEASLEHLGVVRLSRLGVLSRRGLALVLRSAWHYLQMLRVRRPMWLFVGAGSGLFESSGVVLDSYLPVEAWERAPDANPRLLYTLSATHVDHLARHVDYLREHRAIIFSFLISPLRTLLARLILPAFSLNRRLRAKCEEVSHYLCSHSVRIAPGQIAYLHARFAAGVLLYRLFLAPFKIERAFVVSAYSNAEICAVLRERRIPVEELQHGIIGRIHRGYNYATRNPRLPTPDIVRVYNEFWHTELLDAGYYKASAVVVSPRLKYVLAESEHRAFEFDYVAFTGQGICLAEIEQFVREFATLESELHLVYIPHPNESREYTARLETAASGCARVHILTQRTHSTERLIIDSVAHISIYSSCHFDAIHYKGKTYVLDVLPENALGYYLARRPEQFTAIRSASELLRKIHQHDS